MQVGQDAKAAPTEAPLIDPFGRHVSYLRVSVTDRCDLRCVYCMAENMSFLPKKEVLSLEELDRLCSAFVRRGVKRLRLTGGEPLVRKNIISFIRAMGRHLDSGALQELTLTTNGTQLHRFAHELYDCGVRRINVSLDTLDAEKFHEVTRWGNLQKVLDGIKVAKDAGLKIKINCVALKGFNDDELLDLVAWSHGDGHDITFIETMPMGEIDGDRNEQFLSLAQVRERIASRYSLSASSHVTGGPARYERIAETGGRVGFITPMSHNFCESCNRVRVTCTGQLYLCLGQDDRADLRAALRASEADDVLEAAIEAAVARKPMGHDFVIERGVNTPGSVSRHMSVTGG
ncbi:GTP 3',8-cyclase MoaA [Polycladidibacter hongkongensis]|uniref:GTP 3',8-cyclase MoaA n=1 Tax=Polycladidibacter hongkongensis TaxID=1647556 RepID=UPI0009E69B72|nr:GTP 3',8-cyclase MoaA [Pseudovibrio hongkongensis]